MTRSNRSEINGTGDWHTEWMRKGGMGSNYESEFGNTDAGSKKFLWKKLHNFFSGKNEHALNDFLSPP